MRFLAYLSLGVFCCLLVGPFMEGVHAAGCPPQWLDYKYYCYGYFPTEVSWRQARALCQRGEGYLGEIVDGEEPRELADFLRRRGVDKNVWVSVNFRRKWLTTDSALDRTSGFLKWTNMSRNDKLPYLCMKSKRF